jgi:hypothetical protein
VTRLSAARSAKVTGPNFYWAVVWQFLATWSVLWRFIYVTSFSDVNYMAYSVIFCIYCDIVSILGVIMYTSRRNEFVCLRSGVLWR